MQKTIPPIHIKSSGVISTVVKNPCVPTKTATLSCVRYSWKKSLWFTGLFLTSVIGGCLTFSWSALTLFVLSTLTVLLLGHSLGSHRKMIHNSFDCPVWLEYFLVWCGTQVGLCGPLSLLKQHNLRDYAQRQTFCHPYLCHASSLWKDMYWQLHCELVYPLSTAVPGSHRRNNNDSPSILSPLTPTAFYLASSLQVESLQGIQKENEAINGELRRLSEAQTVPERLNKYYYHLLEATWVLQALSLAVIFYLWGGWAFVVWGVAARMTACIIGHWLIGYFAHNETETLHKNWVGKNFAIPGVAVEGQNINSKILALLTMGENWHNNHHAHSFSARLGHYKGEWDPGWWVLYALFKIKLVWNIALPMPEDLIKPQSLQERL